MIRFIILLFIMGMGVIAPENHQEVNILISNIQSKKGVVVLTVYRSAKDFNEEKELKKYRVKKDHVTNGRLNVKLHLPRERVGIVALDDENEDGKMNYNIINYPTEGFGFSNFELKGMRKPDFTDFDFEVNENVKVVSIKLSYL